MQLTNLNLLERALTGLSASAWPFHDPLDFTEVGAEQAGRQLVQLLRPVRSTEWLQARAQALEGARVIAALHCLCGRRVGRPAHEH